MYIRVGGGAIWGTAPLSGTAKSKVSGRVFRPHWVQLLRPPPAKKISLLLASLSSPEQIPVKVPKLIR